MRLPTLYLRERAGKLVREAFFAGETARFKRSATRCRHRAADRADQRTAALWLAASLPALTLVLSFIDMLLSELPPSCFLQTE